MRARADICPLLRCVATAPLPPALAQSSPHLQQHHALRRQAQGRSQPGRRRKGTPPASAKPAQSDVDRRWGAPVLRACMERKVLASLPRARGSRLPVSLGPRPEDPGLNLACRGCGGGGGLGPASNSAPSPLAVFAWARIGSLNARPLSAGCPVEPRHRQDGRDPAPCAHPRPPPAVPSF